MSRFTPLFFLILAMTAAPAQEKEEPKSDTKLLTLERLFHSTEFDPEPVEAIQWSRSGTAYWTFGPEKDKELVFTRHPLGGAAEVMAYAKQFVPLGKTGPIAVERYAVSDDESRLLIRTSGQKIWRHSVRADYWVYDISARELKKLGGDIPPSSILHAELSPDGSRVAYVHDHNIYVQDLRDLVVTRLTEDGSPTLLNGTFDWAYEEEFGLNGGFRWSPDGKRIAYWQLDTTGVRPFYLVNNTAFNYSIVQAIPYPKVGERDSAARVGVVSVGGGDTRWFTLPGDPREQYIPQLDWADNSREIIFQQLNRLQNADTLWLADVEDANVAARKLLVETDAAWVDVAPKIHWVDGGKKFIWLSEQDGWRHAHLVTRDGKIERLLTPGEFDVTEIESVNEKTGEFYFTAAPDRPTQRVLFRGTVDGNPPTRISPADQPGWHSYAIAPGGGAAVHSFSTSDRPPVTRLISLPDHQTIKVMAENKKLAEKLQSLNRPTTEFFRVNVAEGVELDGWMVKPPDFDPAKKYPLLVHVYGEPAGQTVRDAWAGKRQLWHAYLAQQGYVVMSVDNRGTDSPRGREWRKCVYRQIGILATEDQAAALRQLLKDRPYLDAGRIAIWGWSGGGSMSLNMIFRHGDLYGTAMSVAPVANQRYYDSIYQERYMGLPGDNAKGYRDGSPITHAQKLKGNLLLVHGTGDDNCHYQGTKALMNELIAHDKPFELMAYPNRSHSISEGANTTRHLYALLTRYLKTHTPAGAK